MPTRPNDVVFAFTSASDLVRFHAEMRRLGATDQRIFWPTDDEERCFLHVHETPWVSIQRAADTRNVRAFIGRSPHLFVEHSPEPLATERPWPGRLLLIGRDGFRAVLPEHAFHKISETNRIDLFPITPAFTDSAAPVRIPIRPRLTRSEANPMPAVAWRIAEADWLAFVATADERLVERLEFARSGDAVILWARSSPPPVLTIEGTPLAQVLRLDGLLAPPGLRLSPPMRRDAVRERFGEDGSRVVVLMPRDRTVHVESLPTAALRSLAEAIEYRIDESMRKLVCWRTGEWFAPLPFVQVEQPEIVSKKATRRQRDKSQDVEVPFGAKEITFDVLPGTRPPVALPSLENLLLDEVPNEQKSPEQVVALRETLAKLEQDFLAAGGAIDSAERRALWPALGQVNAALDANADASLCWANALWSAGRDPAIVRAWRRTDSASLTSHHAMASPSLGELRSIVTAALDGATLPAALIAILEANEERLPVRVAWLGWLAVAERSGGDVLALTRARDRLLARLHESGLDADRDLPRFLRGTLAASDEPHLDTNRLRLMHSKARRWAAAKDLKTLTEPFVDRVFAYGFARLGDHEVAREMVRKMPPHDVSDLHVRVWAKDAYLSRIEAILEGKRPGTPLPDELTRRADGFTGADRRAVDRLRRASLILEPYDRTDPTRVQQSDANVRALKDAAPGDRSAVFRDLMRRSRSNVEEFAILATAVPLGFRSGDAFAAEVINAIGPIQDKLPAFLDVQDLLRWVQLLETALALAAHHDRPTLLPDILSRLHSLIDPLRGERAGWLIGALGGQSFRFLSRLGLREESRQLLDRMAKLILQRDTVPKWMRRPGLNRAVMLPALLRLAGGWFYFEAEALGRSVVDAMREELFNAPLSPPTRVQLAASYAACLGTAPAPIALPCLDELFDRMPAGSVFYPFAQGNIPFGQLHILESVITSLAAEDFSLDSGVRRLLDEDEHLIRRRIHADVRDAMRQAGV